MLQSDFNNLTDYTNYLVAQRQQYETLSETHIKWYTHKNPYGCWICDVLKLLLQWEDLYYPSPLKNVMSNVEETKESPDNEEIKSD